MLTSPVEDDFSTVEFARRLRALAAHLPLSDAFERDLPQLRGTWWTSQREHMVRWFESQDSHGSGAYSRRARNTSARTTYNRLLAPAAILWMAEALGEDRAVVEAAADAARAETNARKRPALLRRHLPWSRIAELARA
ncbi:hypothetical protein V6N00_13525 [Tersicoccus sp. MR15.9]|uniref:hypothetical protein n=1 Tax=Tersicoccus mangrovi TaxID=3121635 RepID=UPI002FE68CAA